MTWNSLGEVPDGVTHVNEYPDGHCEQWSREFNGVIYTNPNEHDAAVRAYTAALIAKYDLIVE